jgi:hypothetical protein
VTQIAPPPRVFGVCALGKARPAHGHYGGRYQCYFVHEILFALNVQNY